ncbi:MAG TPA: hypothetical protein VNU26_03415, partial [Mycobacteriales bacterium]|nr:hypothetical protein [Mycobacteriales bacterium]
VDDARFGAVLPGALDTGVSAAADTRATPTALPFTGGETTVLAALALGGIAAGSSLLVVARRRP